MTNRRSFFKRLFLAAAAAPLAPLLFKHAAAPKATGLVFPYVVRGNKAIVNPEWKTAPYELAFLDGHQHWLPYRFRDKESALLFMRRLEYQRHCIRKSSVLVDVKSCS